MGSSMNMRAHNGRVPLRTNDPDSPIRLVDFPSKEVFSEVFGNRVSTAHLERAYFIMQGRLGGSTLRELATITGISTERIRQIEAKFLRALAKHYARTERP